MGPLAVDFAYEKLTGPKFVPGGGSTSLGAPGGVLDRSGWLRSFLPMLLYVLLSGLL